MFEIQVWHLLESFSGDSQALEFEGEVLPEFYEDIEFLSPLSFKLTLIALDDGIEAVFENITAKVTYEFVDRDVVIHKIARTFKTEYDPLLSDDIKFIDKKHSTIDLKEVIREEIIMACSLWFE